MIIRANQCATGYKKGSNESLGLSCGRFSTKIHALTNAFGNLVKFIIDPKNEHDVKRAEELVKDLRNTKVLADRRYDSKKFVAFPEEHGCEALDPFALKFQGKNALSTNVCSKSNT